MERNMNDLKKNTMTFPNLILLATWIAGVVIAPGFWKILAVLLPFYAWYLFIERAMQRSGLLWTTSKSKTYMTNDAWNTQKGGKHRYGLLEKIKKKDSLSPARTFSPTPLYSMSVAAKETSTPIAWKEKFPFNIAELIWVARWSTKPWITTQKQNSCALTSWKSAYPNTITF